MRRSADEEHDADDHDRLWKNKTRARSRPARHSPRRPAGRMADPAPSKPPGAPPRPVITSTLLFRMMNPELYVGYNRWIAGVGTLVCGAAIAKVAHMKYEREVELARNPPPAYDDDDE